MAQKPNVDPKWSTNNNPQNNIEPTQTYKANGVQSGVAWGREHLNWQFYAISLWVDWVRSYAVDKDNNLSELSNKNSALINLGGTTTGRALFKVANAASARSTIGITATGSGVVTQSSKDGVLNYLGGTSTGKSLFKTNNASTARSAIGITTTGSGVVTQSTKDGVLNYLDGTTVGKKVFKAASEKAARTAVGISVLGDKLATATSSDNALNDLGGTVTGKSLFKSTSKSDARDKLGMGAIGSELVTAVSKKDALRTLLPVGFVYVQYPTMPTPATLFGGTWERKFEDEGVFFRTEGGYANVFEGGIQQEELKKHSHEYLKATSTAWAGLDGNNRDGLYAPRNRQTSDVGGDETRPKNRTIRVWAKISDTDPTP